MSRAAPAERPEKRRVPLQRVSRVDWPLRWLGLLLPILLTYPLLPFVEFASGWFQIRVAAGAVCWALFAAALLWRRDWRGALAISVMYVLADSWWMLPAFGVIGLD